MASISACRRALPAQLLTQQLKASVALLCPAPLPLLGGVFGRRQVLLRCPMLTIADIVDLESLSAGVRPDVDISTPFTAQLSIRYWDPDGEDLGFTGYTGMDSVTVANIVPTLYSTVGSGSGTFKWTPNPDAYSCAVADAVMVRDFDLVVKVTGHSYIGMGVACGASLVAGADLHPGTYSGTCYASNVGQWTSRFSGLEYSGGYHWPVAEGGETTSERVVYSRFQRRGKLLRQWYDSGAEGDLSHAMPTTDEKWTSVPSYKGGSVWISGQNVGAVILMGEAGSRGAGQPGAFEVSAYAGSPPPPASAPLTLYSTAGSGSGTDTWTPSMSAYSCAVVDRVLTGDFDIVIKVRAQRNKQGDCAAQLASLTCRQALTFALQDCVGRAAQERPSDSVCARVCAPDAWPQLHRHGCRVRLEPIPRRRPAPRGVQRLLLCQQRGAVEQPFQWLDVHGRLPLAPVRRGRVHQEQDHVFAVPAAWQGAAAMVQLRCRQRRESSISNHR